MRKNVLIFSHSYKNGFIEASNQYCQLFDPTHYNVTLIYLDGEASDEIRKKHRVENIKFLNAKLQDKRGLKWRIIKKMLALHRTQPFEIVICHRYKPTYIMLWVAKFRKIPIFISVMHEMNTFKHLSRKLMLRLFGQKNIILAGVSNAVRDDLKKTLLDPHKNQVTTLYNTIDIHATEMQLLSRMDARARLNLADGDFVFGILSRLVPAKDHKTLIDAFAIVKTQCPTAKLLIIGEGELEAQLNQQIASLHLTQDIIMTGFLSHAFALLKALDVFVLSSIKEAFGRVLLEAMIAKCPIIATNTDGIPEVLDNIGTIVEKTNALELARAMLNYFHMTPAEREIQGQMGYERTVNTFSMRQFKEVFWKLPMVSAWHTGINKHFYSQIHE